MYNKPYKHIFICFRRLNATKDEILSSTFFNNFILNLTKYTEEHNISEIVCYGIGQFSQSVTSRYQFAFLLLLRDHLKAKLFLYDPILSILETSLSDQLNFQCIKINEEGKRLINCDTLFFLPHCPKQLLNNILWTNWNNNLTKCIIIGNSIDKINESHSNRFLKENLLYVFYASSIATEVNIENSFRFSDIFNDLSIHTFLEKNLDPEILSQRSTEAPTYNEEDIEFVTSNLESNLCIT